MGIAQLTRGAGAELQALYVVRQGEGVGRGSAFTADDADGENGEVVQFHVLPVQDKLFGAGYLSVSTPLIKPAE